MFRTVTATAAWTTLAFMAYATLCPLNERPELDFGLFSHPDHYPLAVAGSLFGLAYPRQMFFSLHRRFRKRGFTRTIAIADA